MDMQLLCYKERSPTNTIYRKTRLYFQSARKFEKYFSLFAQTGLNVYLRAFPRVHLKDFKMCVLQMVWTEK